MNFIVALLYILPGFISEFYYEKLARHMKHETIFLQAIRAFIFNILIAVFGWLVIYFWKVVLHNWPMIGSLYEFWQKALYESFYAKYALVVFTFAVILGIFYAFIVNLPPCTNLFKDKKCKKAIN